MMRVARINLTLVVILLISLMAIASSSVGAANSPSCTEDLERVKGAVITFGFEGNYPYSVEIDADGKIAAYNPKRRNAIPPFPSPIPFDIGFEKSHISPATVKAVARLATQEAFWKLPESIGQAQTNADNNGVKNLAMFVNANLPCAKKYVVVRDGKNKSPQVQQFAEVFMLLKDLVYRNDVGYKPLQQVERSH